MSVAAARELPAEVDLSDLGPTTPLARGGVGSVESVNPDALVSDRPVVLKRYHRAADVDARLLKELVRWRRDLNSLDRRQLDRVTTWPQTVVRRGAALTGFLMYRVPSEFGETVRLPSGKRRSVLREAQYLMASPARTQRLGITEASTRSRLEVTWTLADVINLLHRNHIVIGDLSTRNVVWRADPGRIVMLDCDSVTLGGKGSPLEPTFTVDWDDPAQPKSVAASADVYKLALFALRALGRSFQSRDPALADELLDPTGKWLLRMSLAADPADRPDASAWARWAAGRRAVSG